MMFPPSILRLRVVKDGRRRARLWLPLFLFWPGMLVAAIALLPPAMLIALICCGPTGVKLLLRVVWWGFVALCSLRGLTVEVGGGKDEVLLLVR